MQRWLLLAVVMAGCLQGPQYVDPGLDHAMPHGEGHDHADPDQHRLAHHARLLDTLDLQEFGASSDLVVGAHATAIHGTLLAVAVFGNHDADGGQQGFHLVDVADPDNMEHLGFYSAGVPVRGDRTIAFSGDGSTVFLGIESGPRPGLAAVDVTDAGNMHEVGFWEDPAGYGPHTVSAGMIDGEQFVFVLSYGVTTLAWDGQNFEMRGRFITADNLGAVDGAQVAADRNDPNYASIYVIRSLYGHDMNLYHDPVTDTPLLLVAYAYDGLKILDMTVPSAPVLLARYQPEADTAHRHYVHSATAERIDGRLIVVAGSETFEDENQHLASPVWVLDATDAILDNDPTSSPELISKWQNPSDAPAGDLTQSVHFFRQQDGMMVLSHYHGGVWLFDLRAATADLEAVGFILPVPVHPVAPYDACCFGFDLVGVPMVMDVQFGPDGTVYAADIIQGVSSVRFSALG